MGRAALLLSLAPASLSAQSAPPPQHSRGDSLQTIPSDDDQTTFIIPTDRGRGSGITDRTDHGRRVAQHTFAIRGGAFQLDGRPIQLISGAMHYARIPRQYWRQRLRMAKAMGLNAIATYVFWNDHEVRPGVFDFHTGNRDLAEFIREAQEEGLWVILRPGPYVCAEWDFGGFPTYLLKTPSVRVRSADPRYLAAASRYVQALAKRIRPLLVTHGGPVLMVQVENEYGSFGADSAYMNATRRMLVNAGIDVPLFTADGDRLFARGGIPGLLPAANGETNYDTLVARVNRFHGGQGPYMVAEFYPGWLMHWGEPFPATPTDSFLPAFRSLIDHGASVNLYMFHGGTNFGFTSGANYSKQFPIEPSMTSYDYDAPLTEAGWPTPKYYAIRDVIRRHVSYPIPDVPSPPRVMAIPPVTLSASTTLSGLIHDVTPVRADAPRTFEDLDQANGLVLYRHRVTRAISGVLDARGVRDRALVFVDGRRVATLDRRTRDSVTQLTVQAGATLDLLVESEGHINYGARLVDDRKGIVAPITLAGEVLHGWSMYPLPLTRAPAVGAPARMVDAEPGVPTLYRGTFVLHNTADTFLDMRGWSKGIVFVNGINLGRYWRLGPQQTLYLPGVWLRRGINEMVVLDLDGRGRRGTVAGLTQPILNQLMPHE